MSLVNYSSSSSSSSESEDDDGALCPPKQKLAKIDVSTPKNEKRQLLPTALQLLGNKKVCDDELDDDYEDSSKHEGRKRSFKHERGIWATYVFIPVDVTLLEDVQELCQETFKDVVELQFCTDLHISLSRTVILHYHLIDSFAKSLEKALEPFSSFSVCLHNLKIYTNEEQTRTFIAIKLDDIYFERVYTLMNQVDAVMHDFKQPRFYEDPSFHVSFLWCLGDRVAELNSEKDKLKTIMEALNNENDSITLDINEIHCKTGNKEFRYKLK